MKNPTYTQDRLITAMAHDIKSPLKYIAESARRMYAKLDKPGLEKEREEAWALFESSTRVYYYTENLLQYIQTQTDRTRIQTVSINVFGLVQDKINIFQTIASEQHTEIDNLIDPELVINTDASLLGVIIYNLLDNAVKVTIDGKIIVSAIVTGQDCTLSIKDTGAGMRPALVEWCNGESNENPPHAGMGLLIVKELLALINGRLFATRENERGTEMHAIVSDSV
jgi:K+-sensing histidine kinase KdpD